MMLSAMQGVLGLASGALVGFSLGLVGGGGSILAVPLMVYVVGVAEPHVAIGTSAIAVAANAAINLSNHARGGTVIWSCALIFAAAGMAGAFGGSILGKMVDGQKLLALFALVMIVIALLMLKTRSRIGLPDVKASMSNMLAIAGLGLATGTVSGFFGIGGGFLIVPALMLATGVVVYAQNPAARPNRNFLLYMCLWAASNVVVPERSIQSRWRSTAARSSSSDAARVARTVERIPPPAACSSS